MPLFADHALASRLEDFVVEDMRAFVDAALAVYPEFGPASLEVAGGLACYVGPDSPVNTACGLGFACEVTDAHVRAVERFYADRGAGSVLNLCPLAHPSLAQVLAARGWTVADFENVLVREFVGGAEIPDPDPHVEVRVVESAEDRELWAAVAANGFSAPDDPTPAEIRLSRTSVARKRGTYLLAYVDGRPAGTGCLHVGDGLGWLSADTTLPEFRGRGVQRSLQRERLRMAADAGCDLAVTESVPGSPSQRNMERLGFRVAYTRVDMNAPPNASPTARA